MDRRIPSIKIRTTQAYALTGQRIVVSIRALGPPTQCKANFQNGDGEVTFFDLNLEFTDFHLVILSRR